MAFPAFVLESAGLADAVFINFVDFAAFALFDLDLVDLRVLLFLVVEAFFLIAISFVLPDICFNLPVDWLNLKQKLPQHEDKYKSIQ